MKPPSSSSPATGVREGDPLLQGVDIWKSYDRGRIEVLRGVSLQVSEAETVALCGSSGCGKSTLLHVLAGLEAPDCGHVLVRGEPIGQGRTLVPRYRRQFGFVFQLHHLLPNLTLRENCLLPAAAANVPRAEALERLDELASAAGIAAKLSRRIRDLSGGERQRAALCRALMNRPQIVVADEPTGALDDVNRIRVFDLLLRMVHDERAALLMATHDRELAGHCDRVLQMKRGCVHQLPKASACRPEIHRSRKGLEAL